MTFGVLKNKSFSYLISNLVVIVIMNVVLILKVYSSQKIQKYRIIKKQKSLFLSMKIKMKII